MRFRHLLLNNFGWKLLAFSLASMVWFSVRTSIHLAIQPSSPLISQSESRVYMRLPVAVLTSPGESREFKVEPAAVSVTITGPTEMLDTLRPFDLTPYVNLYEGREASGHRRRVHLTIPPGVSVNRITPADVMVETVSFLK